MSDAAKLLQELVRIGSINPMGRDLAGPTIGEARLTTFLETFLRSLGLRPVRQKVHEGRENLYAVYQPSGARGLVLLEAHQDTVPVDNMTIDPFGGDSRDGKVWGRGACDVKGGMAAILTAVRRLVAERSLRTGVMVAFTVDEEQTFAGVKKLLEAPLRPDLAVAAEPTSLEIVIAHKGVARWKVRTTGQSCHSSYPERGVNAIYRMAPVIAAHERYAAILAAGRHHPLTGTATLSVGVIRGGTSVNTVPSWCEMEVDRRLLPGEDGEEAFRDAERYLRETLPPQITVDLVEPWLLDPPLDTPQDAEVVSLARRAVAAVKGDPRVCGVPYGTDASKLALGGIPSIVLGPGDIAQAHTSDEWISIEQLDQAVEIYYRIVMEAGKG
ncbi:MAG TPA: M20 family metallopeptidase [Spirochaetia bacterium]|nr:M20 family metallopeptidase [Spirochaetia bacterium]